MPTGMEHGPMSRDGDAEAAAPRMGAVTPEARRGRLLLRPDRLPAQAAVAGVRPFGLQQRRDGLLMVPEAAAEPMPLLVWLHGAGGDAPGTLRMLEPQARARGVALLVPESRGATWDVIMGGFGP